MISRDDARAEPVWLRLVRVGKNDAYWEDLLLTVKEGKPASEAIADMWIHPDSYSMYCLYAAIYVELHAAAQHLGNFNTLVGNRPVDRYEEVLERCIVPNGYDEEKVYSMIGLTPSERTQWANDVNQHPNSAIWIPGDWGYIDNTDPFPNLGYEGENVIYLGGSGTTANEGLFTFDNSEFGQKAYFWGMRTNLNDRVLTFDQFIAVVDGWSTSYPAVIDNHRRSLKER